MKDTVALRSGIGSRNLEKKINHRQRGQVLRWLRRLHGWLGLWGAVLGLLFGISGILLNHRAVMKIPAMKMEESEIQLIIADPQPASADEFTRYLQRELDIQQEPRPPRTDSKLLRNAGFMGKDVAQPQVWKVEFQLPQAAIRAEYIPGNRYATVKREDANVFAFISRMHKAVGMNAGWVLLADSLAGAMIVLSITGVLLWTKMRGSRLVLSGICGTSLALMVLFTMQSL